VLGGRYRIESVLGMGGMGAVYRAVDGERGDAVALKVMLPQGDVDGRALERFRREAEAVAQVDDHVGIVRIRAAGEHHGMPYAVQTLVEGRDLGARLKADGPLPVDEALRLTEAVARAIAHCHGKGIVHRDLKPANVLVNGEGTPFVTDFGIALGGEGERLTKTGEALGTPAYMSPEQADGLKDEIDHLTDVYALGGVLYALVTGRSPFEGQALQVLKQVFTRPPDPVGQHRPDAPPEVDAICQRAMAKAKAARYADADAFADDLAALRRGDPILAKPPGRWALLAWKLRRRKKLVAALGVLALVLCAGSVRVYLHVTGAPVQLRSALLDDLPRALDTPCPLDDRTLSSDHREAVTRLLTNASALRGAEDGPAKDGAAGPGELDLSASRSQVEELLDLAERAASPSGGHALSQLAAEAAAAQPDLPTQLQRVAARQAVAHGVSLGRPCPLDPGDDPETRLLRLLWRLRWNVPVKTGESDLLTPDDLEWIDAELTALVPSHDLEELQRKPAAEDDLDPKSKAVLRSRRAREEVQRKLEAWLRQAKGARSGDTSKYRIVAEELTVGELGHYKAALLRAGKAKVVKALFDDMIKRLPPPGSDRWKRPETYAGPTQVIQSGVLEDLVEKDWPTTPTTLHAPATRLLETMLTRMGKRLGPNLLKGSFLDFVRLLEERVPDFTLSPRAEANLHDSLTDGVKDLFLELHGGDGDPGAIVPLVMVFPRLRRLPIADTFRPIMRQLEDGGYIEAYLAERPTGNGYLVWASMTASLTEGGPNAEASQLQRVAQRYALALGEHLPDAEWDRLGIGPRPAPPADYRPLLPHWVPWCLYELARWVRSSRFGGAPLAERREVVHTLYSRFLADPDLEDKVTPGELLTRLKFVARDMAEIARFRSPAEEEARWPLIQACFQRADRTGREILRRDRAFLAAARTEGPKEEEEEVGLHGFGSELDVGRMVDQLVDVYGEHAARLQRRGQLDEAHELLEELREVLAEHDQPYDRDLGAMLGWSNLLRDQLSAAEAEQAQALDAALRGAGWRGSDGDRTDREAVWRFYDRRFAEVRGSAKAEDRDARRALEDAEGALVLGICLALARGETERAEKWWAESAARGQPRNNRWRSLNAWRDALAGKRDQAEGALRDAAERGEEGSLAWPRVKAALAGE
jgi:hypothetical protein